MQMKQKRTQFKVAINSRSLIHNTDNGRFWVLSNLINKHQDIDKMYLYARDPYEAKYQFLISKRESIGLKHFNEFKALIEYSNDMQGVQKQIDEQNPGKQRKILIVFDDMIANMINNKKTEFSSDLTVYQRKKIKHFS